MTHLSVNRIAGLLYTVAVIVLCLRAGEPQYLWWWLVMFPFAIWIASPVLGGLYLGRRLKRAPVKLGFAILLAIIAVVGFGIEWDTMFIGPSDAQNALILLFVPLYQWVGVVLGFALAWLGEKALGRTGQMQ